VKLEGLVDVPRPIARRSSPRRTWHRAPGLRSIQTPGASGKAVVSLASPRALRFARAGSGCSRRDPIRARGRNPPPHRRRRATSRIRRRRAGSAWCALRLPRRIRNGADSFLGTPGSSEAFYRGASEPATTDLEISAPVDCARARASAERNGGIEIFGPPRFKII